jgi:hypothetical protein
MIFELDYNMLLDAISSGMCPTTLALALVGTVSRSSNILIYT